jgi:hypothetical protein
MAFFLFGKKRRTRRKAGKKTRKPPAAILKKCRKLKIKTTKKVGSKRVYRSISLLKKLIKNKSKKSKKSRKVHRRKHRKVKSKFSFGSSTFTNAGPSGYGYNQAIVQNPGILSQSSMIVTPESNLARPTEMQLPLGQDLAYGVGRNFFTETVPTQIAPNWNVMRQPDGSAYGVGGPFSAYKSPAFGRRRVRMTRRKNESLAHFRDRVNYYKKTKKMYKKINKLNSSHMDYNKREAKIKKLLNKL